MKDKFRYRFLSHAQRARRVWEEQAEKARVDWEIECAQAIEKGKPLPRLKLPLAPGVKPPEHLKKGKGFVPAVRLPERELRRLGLQPHVGYTRHEIRRANHYAMIDKILAAEAKVLEEASIAMRIAFDGRAPIIEYDDRLIEGEQVQANRNLNSTPLQNLYYASKKPLTYLEYVAGERFTADWQRAHSDAPLTVSLEALAMAKLERPTAKDLEHLSADERERAKLPTFRKGPPKRVRRVADVSDSRLDAVQRLGRLRDEISSISFWLLEQVCGHELTLKQCAQRLSWNPDYMGPRFREALWEAAAHYRLTSNDKMAEG